MDEAEGVHEEDLLRRFLAGEGDACRRVEIWVREIVGFKSYGMGRADRDDVVQESLAGIWKLVTRDDFSIERSLRSLVRAVATARCVDRLRRRRPTAEIPESLEHTGPDPYQELLRREDDARVRWALQNLGDACREIIRLHFFEGRTYGQIAAALDRAESTMRVRMFNCMKELRKLVARWE
jgi:RNA polymerase sigma factor (sigma-70 family)